MRLAIEKTQFFIHTGSMSSCNPSSTYLGPISSPTGLLHLVLILQIVLGLWGCRLDDNRLRGRVFLPSQDTPPPPLTPDPPLAITLDSNPFSLSRTATLSWEPAEGTHSVEVQLHRASDGAMIEAWTPAEPGYESLRSLVRGEKYYYQLRAPEDPIGFMPTITSIISMAISIFVW